MQPAVAPMAGMEGAGESHKPAPAASDMDMKPVSCPRNCSACHCLQLCVSYV